ncbi:MAG: carbohydrate kinase [Flavipsychrobacter sp.]|nr:carbohydrate kinase [Flavipsychrobacter sp.]
MNKERIETVFEDMKRLRVLVVGDVMLDNYWWGHIDRMSPEAPVPVVALDRKDSRLGGAANVAVNCIALGAHVTLASVVGSDAEGEFLLNLARNGQIDTSLVLKSVIRPTTTKSRIMNVDAQMLRIDAETTDDLAAVDEHPFIDRVLRHIQIEKPDVVILEDYNKGVLKENVIQRIIAHCSELGCVVAVDPKLKNFLAYKGVTIFKPNLKEVREGLNLPVEKVSDEELHEVHQKLKAELSHHITFITLSDKGVYFNNGQPVHIPAHSRNIADVSGAGDTVIATASLVYAATKDAALMAQISNIAGGLVCEKVGVVPIDAELLKQECLTLLAE